MRLMLTEALRRERDNMARQSDHCVRWLKAQGFEVLRVQSVATGPRITIRPSSLCNLFEGVVDGYSNGINGKQRYQIVRRFDCEVRWEEETEA